MPYKIRTRDEHFLNDGSPKRILALDGGGLRGILTLSYLAEIESILSDRHGGEKNFRLSHYFDLIAGTSTGAIIAAALARGMSVSDIAEKYLDLGQ
ncbi:MAG TPA: patatin-like phospholipase family protein, partial [Candidatus Binatia bacterium]